MPDIVRRQEGNLPERTGSTDGAGEKLASSKPTTEPEAKLLPWQIEAIRLRREEKLTIKAIAAKVGKLKQNVSLTLRAHMPEYRGAEEPGIKRRLNVKYGVGSTVCGVTIIDRSVSGHIGIRCACGNTEIVKGGTLGNAIARELEIKCSACSRDPNKHRTKKNEQEAEKKEWIAHCNKLATLTDEQKEIASKPENLEALTKCISYCERRYSNWANKDDSFIPSTAHMAYIRAIQKHRPELGAKLTSYIITCIEGKVRTEIRKHAKERKRCQAAIDYNEDPDWILERLDHNTHENENGILNLLIEREERKALDEALEKLKAYNEYQYKIVKLRLSGMGYPEIGHITNTARQRPREVVMEATKFLRNILHKTGVLDTPIAATPTKAENLEKTAIALGIQTVALVAIIKSIKKLRPEIVESWRTKRSDFHLTLYWAIPPSAFPMLHEIAKCPYRTKTKIKAILNKHLKPQCSEPESKTRELCMAS